MDLKLQFFSTQVIIGGTAPGVYYSEIFSLIDYRSLSIEFRVLQIDTGAFFLTGHIQETDDPTLATASWSDITDLDFFSNASGAVKLVSTEPPLRFVRANVTMPASSYALFLLEGVAHKNEA